MRSPKPVFVHWDMPDYVVHFTFVGKLQMGSPVNI